MMRTTTLRLLTAAGLVSTMGFLYPSHAIAASSLSGDLIMAQAGGGAGGSAGGSAGGAASGGAGTTGSGSVGSGIGGSGSTGSGINGSGSVGSGTNGSGSIGTGITGSGSSGIGTTPPNAPVPNTGTNVPARCSSMATDAQREVCIRSGG